MQETMFYMGLLVSKQFKLEKEFLIIDNYYDCILYLTRDYFKKEYNQKNMGLLDSINEYINDNLILIENNLCNYNVSETKKWSWSEK